VYWKPHTRDVFVKAMIINIFFCVLFAIIREIKLPWNFSKSTIHKI